MFGAFLMRLQLLATAHERERERVKLMWSPFHRIFHGISCISQMNIFNFTAWFFPAMLIGLDDFVRKQHFVMPLHSHRVLRRWEKTIDVILSLKSGWQNERTWREGNGHNKMGRFDWIDSSEFKTWIQDSWIHLLLIQWFDFGKTSSW